MSYITNEMLAKANEAVAQAAKEVNAKKEVEGAAKNLLLRKGFPLPFAKMEDGTAITIDGSTNVLHITQEEADARFADLFKYDKQLNDAVQAYIDADSELHEKDAKLKEVIPYWNNIEGLYDFATPQYKEWMNFRKEINALPQFEELAQKWAGEFPLTKKSFNKLLAEGHTFAYINGNTEVSKEYARFETRAKDYREILKALYSENAFISGCKNALIRLINMGELEGEYFELPNEKPDEELEEERRLNWIAEKSEKDYLSNTAKELGIEMDLDGRLIFKNEKSIILAALVEKLYSLAAMAYGYESKKDFLEAMSCNETTTAFLEPIREFCISLQYFNRDTEGHVTPFSYQASTYVMV